MDSKRFYDMLKEHGADCIEDFHIRRLSGRSMYGKDCIGFTIPSDAIISTIATLVYNVTDERNEDSEKSFRDTSDFIRAMDSAQWDSMGRRDIIIYFPYMDWTDDMPEDSDDDDDSDEED